MRKALVIALLSAFGVAQAGQVRQVTNQKTVSFDWGMINGNGSEIFVATSSDQFAGGSNPDHRFEIVAFNPTTGVGTPLTGFASSLTHVRHNVAVSEDGQWLAFISGGDLVPGQNGNRNAEVFVMARDGSQLAQLTHDATNDPSPVTRLALSGSGNRVAFASASNPTGGNPQRAEQVFVIDRDGTDLTQLTGATSGRVDHMWISDDGNRIAFSHNGDLTGGNADRNVEVFTIAVGDAAPRQITSSTTGASTDANISGDGTTIVFESNANPTGGNPDGGAEIFAANWVTGVITQVTNSTGPAVNRESRQPWPTNNGQVIFFASNQTPVAAPNVFEIFKINANGTGKTKLTNLLLNAEHPVVSGGGERFTAWLAGGLYTATGTGTNLVQLVVRSVPVQGYPDLSTGGQTVSFFSSANPLGTNADGSQEIFVSRVDGTGLIQLTSFTPSTVFTERPAMDGAGARVYFESPANPFGTNPDQNNEIFSVNTDGTGLTQYTQCNGPGNFPFSGYVEVSDDGLMVVFTSICDLLGGNADETGELFRMNRDGTGLTQITSFPAVTGLTTYAYWPRLDASGTWVVFSGNANLAGGNPDNSLEVWRMRTNGTNLQQLTSQTTAYSSLFPDISANGARIVFQSTADLTGQNADHNTELFLYEPASVPALRQLTQTTDGHNRSPRLSRDGHYAYFLSTSRFAERPADEVRWWLYRYDIDGNTVVRTGGLAAEDTTNAWSPAVNTDGTVAVSTLQGDGTGSNPDTYWEIMVVDHVAPNPPRISTGPAPTTVSFEPDPGAVLYDVIRGSVANLHLSGPDTDLGSVVCVEDNSGDATTSGYTDPDTPAVGQVFFYLFRGSKGANAGPGSYGTNKLGGERLAGPGDCGP